MNEYIATIENTIQSCFFATAYRLNTNMKSQNMAFISGEIDFLDGSRLDFKEFIEKRGQEIEKYKYGYNYRKGAAVIFRYDNAPDPGARSLNSFPNHKHTEDGHIVESHFIGLSMVLEEIFDRIIKDWD